MPPDDDVIPLSRWRAALARARTSARGRVEALLEGKDADRQIRKLPVQELYYAIHEVGLADAHELVAVATPDQVRGLVDLDVWRSDTLDDARLGGWLELFADLGPEALARAVEALDPEAIALWLTRQARVYDLSLGEAPPETPDGHLYPTPDSFFLLDVLPAGEAGKAVERVVDWLYRFDLELGRRVVMSAKWELPSELEEWALRWRSGRMADLGYVEYHEALGIYRYLDPATVTPDREPPPAAASGELPAQLQAAVDEKSFFARALGDVTDQAELERLQGLLLLLVNKAMAADRVEPGDLDAAKKTLGRAIDTLSLGLEYLTRGQAEASRAILAEVALERIFRVGHSLTLKLKRLADTLADQGRVALSLGPAGRVVLLDPPYDRLLAALRLPRPLFATEGPPKAFATLQDVARAAALLDEAARLAAFLAALGLAPEEIARAVADATIDPGTVRFGTLVRTFVAHVLLGEPPSVAPIRARDVPKLAALAPEARARGEAALRARLDEKKWEYPPAFARWLDAWLSDFAPALARPDGLLVRLS